MNRRQMLQLLGPAALAVFWPGRVPARARAATGPAPRIVVLDWGLTEIVLSLGVVPVGVARPPWYRRVGGQPPLPSYVADTGLLYQPNFEVLQALHPDFILVNPQHAPLLPRLQRIAPTLTIDRYQPGRGIYAQLQSETRHLGKVLDRRAEAGVLIRHVDARITGQATRLPPAATTRPMLLFRPLDGRHVTVYGAHSLFGSVLQLLGLRNGWQGNTNFRGLAETDLAALARTTETQAAIVGLAPGLRQELQHSPLWQALPFVRRNRVYRLEALNPLGGLVTAMRFAEQLVGAMTDGPA